MSETLTERGLAAVNNAQLYYEIAGSGQPFVMIHAGVADNRQWNNEFAHFARNYRALRYDLRGYGKSEPVDGEYSNLQDLTALLDLLRLDQPLVLMGCSMGGTLALDFTLTNPSRVKALIMVGSGPSGLKLDVPTSSKFEEAEKAYNDGDLDRVAELETQIWFDGEGRSPTHADQTIRQLAYDMNRNALSLDAKHLGKCLPNVQTSAVERLDELHIPVLVIVGDHDTPYIQAASTYMAEKVPSVQKVTIADAAHLPNMEHPEEFQRIVSEFLEGIAE